MSDSSVATAEAPKPGRRMLLLGGAGALASAALCRSAHAAPPVDEPAAFAAGAFPEALHALGGIPQPSARIRLELPDINANGAVVPVSVTSLLPGTREILIVVDVNPQPVAVRFTIPEGTEPFVSTRIKMAQSGTVYAAVRTGDGLFAAARQAQVAVSGCG